MASHRSDWVPGGRYGTHDKYTEGHEQIFGEQDIFKNLSDKEGSNAASMGADQKDSE
jgi:hypothetical protein